MSVLTEFCWLSRSVLSPQGRLGSFGSQGGGTAAQAGNSPCFEGSENVLLRFLDDPPRGVVVLGGDDQNGDGRGAAGSWW
jgi:hypothetical protein